MQIVDLISTKALSAIADRLFPGCVIGISLLGGDKFILAYGRHTYDDQSRRMEADSIFDVASITKAVPTSCVALKLVEEHTLDIDGKLISYVPELSNPYREQILIRHLLSQGLDCSFTLSPHKNEPPESILQVIFAGGFNNPPGQKHFSTNAASILLSLVIERATGENIEQLSQKYFFSALGMENSSLLPERFDRERIVPTEIDPWRGRVIQGEVHDETAYVLKSKHIVGSAGLFSTAPDLLTFLEMLMNKGVYGSTRYFGPETIEAMHTNQFSQPGQCAGLGWDLSQPHYMGRLCTDQTFGKTGYTGCSCLCDISLGVSIVILSNYHFPERKGSATPINRFRQEIAEMVFAFSRQLM